MPDIESFKSVNVYKHSWVMLGKTESTLRACLFRVQTICRILEMNPDEIARTSYIPALFERLILEGKEKLNTKRGSMQNYIQTLKRFLMANGAREAADIARLSHRRQKRQDCDLSSRTSASRFSHVG